MALPLDDFLQDSEGASYSDLCKICLRTTSKYVCPRCNTPYCSVDCYKSELHLDCSESFYQEWVEKELKNNKVTPEGQKKMLEILNRMNGDVDEDELDSDDEEVSPDIYDRLAGIDLNDVDKVWENLTEPEKAAFQELLSSGEITNLIQPWDPWWSKRFDEPKVTPIDSSFSFRELIETHKKKCPSADVTIRPLEELVKTKPPLSVVYDLINILGAYVIISRYYNGDHFDFPEEAATMIFTLSQSLISPQKFPSCEMALEAVGLRALINEGLDASEKEINTMKTDVRCITDGPSSIDRTFYVLAALSDILNLFSFDKELPPSGKFHKIFKVQSLNLTKISQKDRKLCLKRITFFLSYARSFDFNQLVF